MMESVAFDRRGQIMAEVGAPVERGSGESFAPKMAMGDAAGARGSAVARTIPYNGPMCPIYPQRGRRPGRFLCVLGIGGALRKV